MHGSVVLARSCSGPPPLHPPQELIKQAEAYLKAAAKQPGYGINVLQVGEEIVG